jgi:methylmalonyl-CoA mutase N-terminal domain/subunit
MALCSYDEAYTIPSEKAARISLRTMQILIEEMGLCSTVDPLGGSYYVETLTNQLEEKIRDEMREVDRQGGIVHAISGGHIQDAVSKQAYQNLRKIERGEVRWVGVNCYRIEEEEPSIVFHPFNREVQSEQIKRLQRIRTERDNAKVEESLQTVRADAESGRNVMPSIIQAVKEYATVGELTLCLVEVFGRYEEPIRF